MEGCGLKPLGWVISVSDGNSGVGIDSTAGKAFMSKLYYNLSEPVYVSGSYYNSGRLDSSNAEMTIAGLASRPQGANSWDRSVWEWDVRYDFGKGKKQFEPAVFSDSKVIMRVCYGGFKDEANTIRKGSFGFIDGIYNGSSVF